MQEPLTRIPNLILTQKWRSAPMLEIPRTRQGWSSILSVPFPCLLTVRWRNSLKTYKSQAAKLLYNCAKITLNIWLCLIFRRSRFWCSYWRRRRYSLGWKRDGSFMADSLTGEFRDLSIWQYSAYNWCWAFQLATRLGHLNSFAWFVSSNFKTQFICFQQCFCQTLHILEILRGCLLNGSILNFE